MVSDADTFAKNSANFLNAVRRLHKYNNCMCFWNASREFKIMCRVDRDDATRLEVAIPDDDDDAPIRGLLDLAYAGYYDDEDPDIYVVDSCELPLDALPTDDAVRDAMRMVNTWYATQICWCGDYLMAPGDAWCCCCECRADERDGADTGDTCCICHEPCLRLHKRPLSCCKTTVHIKCMTSWISAKGTDASCPVCRARM